MGRALQGAALFWVHEQPIDQTQPGFRTLIFLPIDHHKGASGDAWDLKNLRLKALQDLLRNVSKSA